MSSVVIAGDTSGSVTLQAPAAAGSTTINLPSVTGGSFVVSNASGFVGIGKTNPGYILDVLGIANLSGTTIIDTSIEINTTGTGNRFAFIDFHGDDTYTDYSLRILRGNEGANATSLVSHRGTGTFAIQAAEAAPITLSTSSVERMRIDASGRVGINSNSPTNQLQVTSENEWPIASRYAAATITNRPTILIQRSLGTLAAPTAVTTNTVLGGFSGGGYDGTTWSQGWNGGVEVSGLAAENWSATNRGAHLAFYTTSTASTTIQERMRIDASGNVGIGALPDSAANNTFLTVRNSSGLGGGIVQAKSNDTDLRLQSVIGGGYVGTFSNNPLLLFTNSTEKMRIDAAGNVLVAQASRGTIVTDNDLSFDMNVASNFKCTPTGTGALTFTNITAGQSGYVLLVNTGGHVITAAATTEVNSNFLSTVSTVGTYLLSYFTDGINVYVTTAGAMA